MQKDDLCAKCKKPLERIHGTARIECCKGGYLSEEKPIDSDRWFKVKKIDGLFWYVSILKI